MDAKAFDAFCLSLPGAAMTVQWGEDNVYKVGGKMFTVMAPSHGSCSFQANDVAFEMLTETGVGKPAPYMARHKWVWLETLDRLPDEDLKAYLRMAHALTVAKLTKKAQRELGTIPPP